MYKFIKKILVNPVWTGIGGISAILGIVFLIWPPTLTNIDNPGITDILPSITISIDETNKIHRTIAKNEGKWKLGWVIKFNGEQVLKRNALGETTYRYFKKQPGVYTVFVDAWVKNKYQAVSNIESYTIR